MAQAKKEKRNHFYFRHCLASGKIRDVEVYSGPISINKKTLLYSIIHDITERREAEHALQRSEARLAEAQYVAQLGHWEWDLITVKETWSEEMLKIMG